MQKSSIILLSLCAAGAHLSWLYAWVAFVLFSFFQRLFPLPEAIGIFGLAAFWTRLGRRRRWRVIQVIGLHLVGVILAGLWVVHVFYYRLEPWWSVDWLNDFQSAPGSAGMVSARFGSGCYGCVLGPAGFISF